MRAPGPALECHCCGAVLGADLFTEDRAFDIRGSLCFRRWSRAAMRNSNLPFTYCFFRFWRSGRHSRPRLPHSALPTSGPRCCCTGWWNGGIEQRLSPCVVGEGQYVCFGERRVVREHAEVTLRRVRGRVGGHGLTRGRQSVMEDVRSAWLSSCRRLERSTRGVGR